MKEKWDLTKLIRDSRDYKHYVAKLNELLSKFPKYKGKLLKDDKTFCEALNMQKEMDMICERIYVYSFLGHYEDMSNPIFQEYKEIASSLFDKVESVTSFVNPELLSSEYSVIDEYIKKNKNLRIFEFSLKNLFRYKAHVLSDKEEKLLSDLQDVFKTPRNAYDAIDNVDIKFDQIKDENGNLVDLTPYNYGTFLTSKSTDVRRDAFMSEYKYYKEHINTISALYIGSIKNDASVAKVKKYKNSLSASLFDDKISPKLYKKLVKVTNKNLYLLKEFYKFKEGRLGQRIHMYDLYVNTSNKITKKIDYKEAVEVVNKALIPLGDEYLNIFNSLLDTRCVDVYPKDKKRSGAYEWGTYGVDPYVSLNYENNIDSVSTLAHEMGHAMHSYYSNRNQDYLYASYPIFLAEIASTVNEILLSNYLYNHANNPEEKKYYLMEFLDKFKATVFRQAMFADFELQMHEKYEKGEILTKDILCDTYYNLNVEHYAPAVEVDEEIKYEWARIPHFYTPYYVYKYATGFICALLIVEKLMKEENFNVKYIDFLSSGSSAYPLDLLKKLDIDINKEETLQKGFDIFRERLTLLKEIERDD